MSSRPHTPAQDGELVSPVSGYGTMSGSRPNSFVPSEFNAVPRGGLADDSSLAGQNHHASHFNEELDASQRGSSIVDGIHPTGNGAPIQRSDSQMSHGSMALSRSGTLKKKPSLSRKGSLSRRSSRKSLRAGSVRSLNLGEREKYGGEDANSAFYVPVPTTGSPTEELANRFQAWRKILKDLIVFFKEIQKSYETRSKLLLSAGNIVNNMAFPTTFLESGGLGDATEILRDYYKQGIAEASKAREVENEVVLQLTGLRHDLQQKTKEIKSLSGDFKNSVDKEVEGTRKAVRGLQESLGLVDVDPAATSGKNDPFIMRLAVDRQLEKQIEEENYLHRAYLNLESSGRELEAIVVGEVQKAYNAYASILKREADEAYDTVEKLRAGPISMPKDHEWHSFIAGNDQFIDPQLPIRNIENINYPGKDHPAAAEVRAGMLERKSKYLRSYTPGWYVLSPTHLHEFKSSDRLPWQTPVMSLYLPEQKLGSHSQPDSSSHKFMLKGRQTGTMHRGHGWVFRAETYDTMMAWYEDINNLMNKTGEARNAFVRRHIRSLSGSSQRAGSISSDGAMEEDEADRTPYSGHPAMLQRASSVAADAPPPRPQPGGRFPSDVQIERHLHAPVSHSSGDSSRDREAIANVTTLPGSEIPYSTAANPEQSQIERTDFAPNPANEKTLEPSTQHNQQDRTHYQENAATFTPAHLSSPPYSYELSNPLKTSPAAPSSSQHYPEQSHPVAMSQQADSQQQPTTQQYEMSSSSHPEPILHAAGDASIAGAVVVEGTHGARESDQQHLQQPSTVERHESEASRHTPSTFSGMASSPASSAVTSPLPTEPSGSVSGVTTTAVRPPPLTKTSSSNWELPTMPGKYPKVATA